MPGVPGRSGPPRAARFTTPPPRLAGHAGTGETGRRSGRSGPLLAALPEHSTPAAPDAANAAVEPAAFNKLKADFSSCLLPYSQALDVSRTYLGQLGSSRFEEMRTFRRCITEFVLDPAHEPAGFESWLWRYPVRVDIAIEYLGITPEEYATLFQGAAAPPCAPPASPTRRGRHRAAVPGPGAQVSAGAERSRGCSAGARSGSPRSWPRPA